MRFRLVGWVLRIDPEIVTWEESQLIHDLEKARMELLDKFDENSRKLMLNVPKHRCYFNGCRNKAKFKGWVFEEEVWFCKKHNKEYLEQYV